MKTGKVLCRVTAGLLTALLTACAGDPAPPERPPGGIVMSGEVLSADEFARRWPEAGTADYAEEPHLSRWREIFSGGTAAEVVFAGDPDGAGRTLSGPEAECLWRTLQDGGVSLWGGIRENPATGGGFSLAALDAAGRPLFRARHDGGKTLSVTFGGETVSHCFRTEEDFCGRVVRCVSPDPAPEDGDPAVRTAEPEEQRYKQIPAGDLVRAVLDWIRSSDGGETAFRWTFPSGTPPRGLTAGEAESFWENAAWDTVSVLFPRGLASSGLFLDGGAPGGYERCLRGTAPDGALETYFIPPEGRIAVHYGRGTRDGGAFDDLPHTRDGDGWLLFSADADFFRRLEES